MGDEVTPQFDDQEEVLSEEALRVVYHSVNEAIFVHGPDGKFIDANKTGAEMFGYSREEIRQGEVEDFSSGNPPYTQENALERVRKAAEGNPQKFEWQGKDRDGNVFWKEVSLSRAFIDGELRILSIVRDIDERKQYEDQLETQRDNLKVLNQVVRHDIRNVLQVVLTCSEILEPHVAKEGSEYVERLLEAARDAIEITTMAKEVTEVMLQSDVDPSPVRMRHVLKREIDNVRSTHERATIRIDGSIPDVEVLADDLLESVFRNLLKNGIKHNDKDSPMITVTAERGDDRVQVRIADNGPGVPDERKRQIFQEGETELESEGTGIGLYLAETLVDRYDGEIWVKDNEPEGSVFVVELSLVQ